MPYEKSVPRHWRVYTGPIPQWQERFATALQAIGATDVERGTEHLFFTLAVPGNDEIGARIALQHAPGICPSDIRWNDVRAWGWS